MREDGPSRCLLLLCKLFNDLGDLWLELDHIGAPSFQGDVPERWTVLLFSCAYVKTILIRLDKPLVCRGYLDEVLLKRVPSPHVIFLRERSVVIQSLLLTLLIS